MAIEQRWTMNNSDIMIIGRDLGFDWNEVCLAVQDCRIYGDDGDGCFCMGRDDYHDYHNAMITAIFDKIFEDHPSMMEIDIIN